MSTKDQEREALKKIEKIVEDLGGDNSYLGMTFKGCFDLAEENISNDFGDSWMLRWSAAIDEQNKIKEALREAQQETESLKAELETVKNQLEQVRDARDRWKEGAEEKGEQLYQVTKDRREALNRATELETENMKLKAKLYDLMTA